MKSRGSAHEQLRALERWRKSQLDSARAAHLVLLSRLEQHQGEVLRLKQQISEAQQLARDEISRPSGLAPLVLLRLSQFAAWQAVELQRGELTVRALQAEADAAHEVLEARFRELSVIERLSERRADEQRVVDHRRQQRWMDEQAAGRGGAQC